MGGRTGELGTGIFSKNRKKSNAYFGKSLVRLACSQEKNKEKSDRKNETRKKSTARRNS